MVGVCPCDPHGMGAWVRAVCCSNTWQAGRSSYLDAICFMLSGFQTDEAGPYVAINCSGRGGSRKHSTYDFHSIVRDM